jgi:hypothetical protein
MSATRLGRSITMTATGDEYTGIVCPIGINFQGTGLTAGQRVLVTDSAGSVIADYITEGTSDNADLLNGRPLDGQFYQGIKIAAGTVAGTWVLTVILA